MPPVKSLLPLMLMASWLAACYAVRFLLMEAPGWVAVCDGGGPLACDLRSLVGLLIHHQALGHAALLVAGAGFVVRGRGGRSLAWLGLALAMPAIALYTVTPGVLALLAAALRLVRSERPRARAISPEAPAQPRA